MPFQHNSRQMSVVKYAYSSLTAFSNIQHRLFQRTRVAVRSVVWQSAWWSGWNENVSDFLSFENHKFSKQFIEKNLVRLKSWHLRRRSYHSSCFFMSFQNFSGQSVQAEKGFKWPQKTNDWRKFTNVVKVTNFADHVDRTEHTADSGKPVNSQWLLISRVL